MNDKIFECKEPCIRDVISVDFTCRKCLKQLSVPVSKEQAEIIEDMLFPVNKPMQDTKYKEMCEFTDKKATECLDKHDNDMLDAFSGKYKSVDERFDKEFVETCDIWDCYNDNPSPQTVNRIKDFLHTELDKAVSEALEKQREELLEKLPKEYEDILLSSDRYVGFNQCLSEIKSLLSNK